MDFYIGVAAVTTAYAASGLALSWFLSRLGLLNLASGAVAGTSGYVFALVFGTSHAIWLAISAGVLAGSMAGAAITLLAQRLRDLEFAIASFAVQIVWVGIVTNSVGWLGGPLGIAGVVSPPGTAPLGAATAALVFASVFYVAVVSIGLYERWTPFPAAAAVVARGAELADTLGIQTTTVTTILGIAFGAATGAFGIFLATYGSYVGIQVFSTQLSITLLALSFIAAKPVSALFGATLLVGCPELLRLIGYTDADLGYVRMILSGLIILLSIPTALKHILYETPDDS